LIYYLVLVVVLLVYFYSSSGDAHTVSHEGVLLYVSARRPRQW